MQMTGQRLLPVSPQQAWDALNDPEMLKACIPGCESVTLTGPDQYEVLMAARIGPVAAKFKGKLTQSDVVEPVSYKIRFDGQGGVAGFGKGSADVRLTAVPEGTQLDYDVSAQVGGKIAQIGSRLVDAAAAKIADEFFASFETKLGAIAAASAAALASAAATTGGEAVIADANDAQRSPASTAANPPSEGAAVSARARTEAANRQRWVRWALLFAIAAVLIVYLSR
jgi:carbon monoxide dehydrogenase subunit G